MGLAPLQSISSTSSSGLMPLEPGWRPTFWESWTTRARATRDGYVRMDLHIPATRNELPRLRQFAESFCTQLRPSWRDDMSAGLAIVALHEAACNVIEHGYRDRPGQSIDLIACGDHDSYEFVLIDSAPEFNPQHRTRPALDGSHERGFGVYMMHACFDRVRYMRRHAQNCLRLSRRWDRTPAAVRRFETALASITIALD